ncbi:MAG: hypothetical protein JRC99_00020 [Deltaproteobacteria bacterium]|nr:hypothetical protein [Deltaproteobacteria bacterium]
MSENLEISISGSDPVSTAASLAWIKMTLDPSEKQNQITKKQLAQWLNSAYGVTDPCRGLKSEDAYVPGDPADSTEQRLQAALTGGGCYEAADLLAMNQQCNPLTRAGSTKKFNVYVHCSSQYLRDRYTFRCSSDISPSRPSPAESVIQVIIDFSDAGEVPVYRFAERKEVLNLWREEPPAWLGDGDVLIGRTRVDPDTIGVSWSNGRVVLSEPVSGRLVVQIPIKYDILVVSVPGTVIAGKRNYTATAYAFEESLSSPAQVALEDEQEDPAEGSDCQLCDGIDDPIEPGDLSGVSGDPKPCQERINWEQRNRCTNKIVDYGVRYEPTSCPNKVRPYPEVTYTTAETPASAKWSASEYKDACCEEVKGLGCLTCKLMYRTYNGTTQVLPSRDYWRNRYPKNEVIFNFVPTEDGGPCGTITNKFLAPGDDCCAGVASIVYDKERSPDIVAEGYQVTIYWTGGIEPYTVDLAGTGFYLSATEDVQEIEGLESESITIFARNSCGACEVKISDACNNNDTGRIRSTNSVWFTVLDTMQDDPSTWAGPCIIDGYRWWDDYCASDPNTCTGTGTFHCDKPSNFPDNVDSCEGNIKQEPRCPG